MTRTIRHAALAIACILTAAATTALAAAATQPSTQPTGGDARIRVMSFNLRTAMAPDGRNAWSQRTDLVAQTIRAFDPDLLGTQEVVGVQRDWLHEQFPDYGFLGVSRNDGRDGGEAAPVMYRLDRFDVLAGGHFWLSETPDAPGSVGWDAALTRIATWARLRDRRDGGVFVFANTHFDHMGRRAREQSSTVIRAQLARYAGGAPVVLTGDFNAPADSPAYRTLLGDDWRDTFRTVHPTPPVDGEGTFHGFKGKPGRDRIDWIVASPEWRVEAADIDRTTRDGRFPSDHFAVNATLRLTPATRPATVAE